MRRFFSFLLMSIFIWQLAGFFVFFELERFHVRKEIKKAIKHSLPEKEFKQFNFSALEFKSLTWINDHEFKMNGRMYDVVKKSKINSGYSVSCIDDIQETVLFAKLDEATVSNLNNQPEKSPLKSCVKVFKSSYLNNEFDIELVTSSYIITQKDFFHYDFIFAQFKVAEHLEPPKILV